MVSDRAGAADSATLAGAGSTFATTVVEEWARLYRSAAPGVDISYQAIGSSAGVGLLTTKGADFAVSEITMTPDQQRAAGGQPAVQVPLMGGAVAVAYNLPGVDGLQLSADTLARIYTGEIRRWDNAAVKRDNPGRQLPSTAVTAVHRSEGAGTTLAFTRYLTTAGREVWPSGEGESVAWRAGIGAVGSTGVLAEVGGTVGAVGYVVAAARSEKVQTAALRNGAGEFLAPTPVAVDSAMIGATGFQENLTLVVPAEQSSPTAYPIVAISHLVFLPGLAPQKDLALRHFAAWFLADGQRSLTRLGFAPLPLPLAVRTLEGLENGGILPRR